MSFVDTFLETNEEILYRTTLPRHMLRRVVLVIFAIILILTAFLFPILLALVTRRFGRFPVIWGLPDSLWVLIITVGLWLLPVLVFWGLAVECAQMLACELAITDQRVLGRIPSHLLFRTLNLPLNQIVHVNQKGNRVVFRLKNGRSISASGFQNAALLVDVCRLRLIVNISLSTGSGSVDLPNQRLKRLKEALDTGLITLEEYTLKKNEILKQM